jgi:hypothetical protein
MATRPSAKAVGKRALRESKKIEQVLAAPRVRKPRPSWKASPQGKRLFRKAQKAFADGMAASDQPKPEKRFEAEEMLHRLSLEVRELAAAVRLMQERESLRAIMAEDRMAAESRARLDATKQACPTTSLGLPAGWGCTAGVGLPGAASSGGADSRYQQARATGSAPGNYPVQPPNPLLVRVRELEERCAAAESINDARAAAHMERIERLERAIFA